MLKSMLAIPALVLCLCGVGTSQDPEAGNKVHSISVDVTRVVLYATVREDKSAIVGDLAKEQFTVLEDGKPQEILFLPRRRARCDWPAGGQQREHDEQEAPGH